MAAVLVVATAVTAGADDPKAPLADAKQQLQQLKKDESTSKGGDGEAGLKGALPELKTTLQGHEALPLPGPSPTKESQDQERKQKAKKNWLVDGYERLDSKSVDGKTGDKDLPDATSTDGKERDSESGSQDDLINLYEKQGKSNDPTSGHDRKGSEKASHSAPADPFAPFLQGWLANSPVRDAALSALPKTEGSGTAPDPSQTLLPVEAPTAAAVSNGPLLANAGPIPVADNPYLLALTMPALPESSPLAAPVAALGTQSLSSGPAGRSTLNGPADSLAPPAKLDQYKPPPTPADDDKKYFPQLKRF